MTETAVRVRPVRHIIYNDKYFDSGIPGFRWVRKQNGRERDSRSSSVVSAEAEGVWADSGNLAGWRRLRLRRTASSAGEVRSLRGKRGLHRER